MFPITFRIIPESIMHLNILIIYDHTKYNGDGLLSANIFLLSKSYLQYKMSLSLTCIKRSMNSRKDSRPDHLRKGKSIQGNKNHTGEYAEQRLICSC